MPRDVQLRRDRPADRAWYLCAVAAIQNEAPYLDEWLAFCVAEGVEHVLLYDNFSTDSSRAVLQPWIAAGIVELIDWPVHWKEGAQTRAFAARLPNARYIEIAGAGHEMLMERDVFRAQWWQAFDAFME